MIFFYILVFAAPMPNHPLFEAQVAGVLGNEVDRHCLLHLCVSRNVEEPESARDF